MNPADRLPLPLAGTVLLAAGLWFVTFYLSWSTFWVKISVSAGTIAALALFLQPPGRDRLRVDARVVLIGILSAGLLYAIFLAGKFVSTLIFPFAGDQIGGIYAKGSGTSPFIIAMLLFFIIGPAEEIYWRGYLQRNLMDRYGELFGWVLATAIYALVHVWSFNFMLVGAAAVAGAFWGAVYWRTRSLSAVMISHAIWSTVIFTVFPMHL